MPTSARRRIVPTILAVLGCAAASSAQASNIPSYRTFEAAKEAFEIAINEASFQWRARAIEALADTKDGRALPILRKLWTDAKYAGIPGNPEDDENEASESGRQMRFLVAGALAQFALSEGASELLAWAAAAKDDVDAWLAYQAYRAQCEQVGPEAVLALARDPRTKRFARAAAIHALGRTGATELLPLVTELLDAKNLPKLSLDRHLVAAACATGIRSLRYSKLRRSAEYLAAADAVVGVLERTEFDPGTKLAIARQLAALTETEAQGLSPAAWRELVRGRKPAAAAAEASGTGVHLSFMGVRASGHRIVYVVDFSDSMLEPFTQEERTALGDALSGVGGSELSRRLPWDRIQTRLDAARECLKISLDELGPGKEFAIVTFGTEARALRSTPGLTKATPEALIAAKRELDLFNPLGTTTAKTPVLRGKTNLHGGLRLAFRLTAEGPVKDEDEAVNPAAFATGADTVFVLSDGEPNWDDYPGLGPEEPDRGSGDVETGRETKPASDGMVRYRYPGPFADRRFFLRDLERMNLFRKVEIHCVGIGKAHTGWMTAIAREGLGQVRFVGSTLR